MATSQRVQVLSDTAEQFFSVVKEFIANPNLIKELENEIKRLNSLTKTEELKVAEARELLRNHASLVKSLDDRESALADGIRLHNELSADLSKKIAEHTVEYRDRFKDLDAAATNQAETEKRHIEERAKLTADGKKIQADAREKAAALDAREAALDKQKYEQQALGESLATQGRKLKENADKMKALVEDGA